MMTSPSTKSVRQMAHLIVVVVVGEVVVGVDGERDKEEEG